MESVLFCLFVLVNGCSFTMVVVVAVREPVLGVREVEREEEELLNLWRRAPGEGGGERE